MFRLTKARMLGTNNRGLKKFKSDYLPFRLLLHVLIRWKKILQLARIFLGMLVTFYF